MVIFQDTLEYIEILKLNLINSKTRLLAFKEFHSDTINQTFNDPKITVGIEDKEYEEFLKLADKY